MFASVLLCQFCTDGWKQPLLWLKWPDPWNVFWSTVLRQISAWQGQKRCQCIYLSWVVIMDKTCNVSVILLCKTLKNVLVFTRAAKLDHLKDSDCPFFPSIYTVVMFWYLGQGPKINSWKWSFITMFPISMVKLVVPKTEAPERYLIGKWIQFKAVLKYLSFFLNHFMGCILICISNPIRYILFKTCVYDLTYYFFM